MIEWQDEWSVGITSIDDDHKVLLDLLNQYLAAIESKKTLKLNEIFRELERYTYYHFAREEGLLEQCGYEKLEEHKVLHQTLCDKLLEYYDDILYGVDEQREGEIKNFLQSWLSVHIMNEDFQYRDSMAKLNLG